MERVLHANKEPALNPDPFNLVERDFVALRSYSLVVRGLSYAAMAWA
jgi:hypothetical protein